MLCCWGIKGARKKTWGSSPLPSGFIPDDQVVAKSKFLISDTVTLTTSLMPGEYTVVASPPLWGMSSVVCGPFQVPRGGGLPAACLQPEGSASPCNMTFWCSRSEFRVREIPFWTKKVCPSHRSGPFSVWIDARPGMHPRWFR